MTIFKPLCLIILTTLHVEEVYKIIKNKKVIHWTRNSKTINEMKKLLDNYFFDIVKNEMRIDFNAKNLSDIIDSLINLAIEHEDE